MGLVIHEREVRNWIRVRKYAVKCMRDGENRTQLAYRPGVSPVFLSKWWAVWKENKTWGSLKDRSSRPNRGGTSDFDVWCKENGIHPIMAGIRRPTPIGKIERRHRPLIDEFLCQFTDLAESRRRLPDYLERYNTGRPHWGIGLRIPAEVYFADLIIPEDFAPGASVHEVP